MKNLNDRDLSLFCQQVAMIIHSGILAHSGIQMIAEDTKDLRKKAVFQQIADKLADNKTFAEALSSTSSFPDYFINMIRIGSETGSMDVVLDALSDYYDRRANMVENLKSAILYPAILVAMMLVVLIFLATTVLPVFEKVLNNLGGELSSGIIFLMGLGAFVSQFALFLLIALFIILGGAYFLLKTESGQSNLSKFIAKRKASEKFSIAAFTSSMSLMTKSGVGMEHAMKLSLGVVPNSKIKNKLNNCIDKMEQDQLDFVATLEEADLLSHSALGIISTGLRSGSLETAMKYVAELYEDEYLSALIRKVSLIEPIAIAVISILIGSILISVMLPLLGILSSIG
jgi:type IV pilus assembly protein PilC